MAAAARHGYYRFSCGGTVFYVEAHWNSILKDNEYGFPPAILRSLSPRPPSCNWADIKEDNRCEWRVKMLKGAQQCWHPKRIDLRELEPIKYFNPNVCQCAYQSQLAVAKIARFEFEIQYIEQESATYRAIDGHNIGPRVLGHLTENDRVMGILLEYIPARPGLSSDLKVCLKTLQRLHEFKILLNDTNKFNFLVSIDGQRALVCDFSNSTLDADDERLKCEEEDLVKSLEADYGESDDDWSDFGQERLKSMSATEYRI
jgi:hypothetical protein